MAARLPLSRDSKRNRPRNRETPALRVSGHGRGREGEFGRHGADLQAGKALTAGSRHSYCAPPAPCKLRQRPFSVSSLGAPCTGLTTTFPSYVSRVLQETIRRMLLLSFKNKTKVSKEAQELAAVYLRQFVHGKHVWMRTRICAPCRPWQRLRWARCGDVHGTYARY